MKQIEIGYLYVLSIPIAAGIGTIEGIEIAGNSYTGWMWLTYFISGIFFILKRMALIKFSRISFPFKIWFIWFGCLWSSMLWIEAIKPRNLQDALQITSPLIAGYASYLFICDENQFGALRRAFSCCFLLLLLSFVASETILKERFGVTYFIRSAALTSTLIGCVFFSGLQSQIWLSILGWIGCIGFTIYTGSRTTTIALLSILCFYPLYSRFFYKVFAIFILVSVGIFAFYTPIFQARFFGQEKGSIKRVLKGDFVTMGRFETWPIIWEDSKPNIVFGHGVGEAYSFVPTVWPIEGKEVYHVHNDYLRIIYEQGLFGLFCFLLVVSLQLVSLRKRILITNNEKRRAFIASYLGLLCLMVVSFTDNTIVYNLWYMNPLFALIGAAYGLKK